MAEDAPEDIRRLVERALDTYDITVDGNIEATSTGDRAYEVEAPFRGELIIDETFANQGSLLYNKSEEGELSLKGVRDGQLLLVARIPAE